MAKYEIHVNARNANQDTESGLLELGFSSDPFLPTGLDHTPTNHFAWESYNDAKSRDTIWDKTLSLVRSDKSFQGYAESETIPDNYRVKFDNPNAFHGLPGFPIQGLKAIQLPEGCYKSADIHIKRGLDLKRDTLDTLLLENVFYEVHTPRNRIFTLHTEWVGDAKAIFEILKDYFSKSGGVKGIRLEIVSGFYRSPNFPLADAVPKGQFKKNE